MKTLGDIPNNSSYNNSHLFNHSNHNISHNSHRPIRAVIAAVAAAADIGSYASTRLKTSQD